MGFQCNATHFRDLSVFDKIFNNATFDKNIGYFLVDRAGILVGASETLPILIKSFMKNLLGQSVTDFRKSLLESYALKSELPKALFDRTDFEQKDNKGRLIWMGFPLGHIDPPAGIYFLLSRDRSTTENDLKNSDIPSIIHMKNKISIPLARYLLDDGDINIFQEFFPNLMEWEKPDYRDHRIILSHGATIDEAPTPYVFRCHEKEGVVMVDPKEVAYGDVMLFKRLSQTGSRPLLVEHTDDFFVHEIFLPLAHYTSLFGWIGIKLPDLSLWNTPARLNFEEIVRGMGEAMGEERIRLGLVPSPIVDKGIFDFSSFREIVFGMMYRPLEPRPFVLMKVLGDMTRLHELRVFIDRAKRPSDIMTHSEDGLLILFPDQDPFRIKFLIRRYLELFGRLAMTKPGIVTGISTIGFPEVGLREFDPFIEINNEPVTEVPLINENQSTSSKDKDFKNWFERFLVLKDWN